MRVPDLGSTHGGDRLRGQSRARTAAVAIALALCIWGLVSSVLAMVGVYDGARFLSSLPGLWLPAVPILLVGILVFVLPVIRSGVHDMARTAPAHWLVGRAMGMRVLAYVLRDLMPPFPGLKIDYATYLRVAPEGRAWMHASGAIASKIGPFLALAFWPASGAPGWAAWAILGYGVLIIGTDVFISTRKSDWKRFRREMRIARVQAANR